MKTRSDESTGSGTQFAVSGPEGATVCTVGPGEHVLWLGAALLVRALPAGGMSQAQVFRQCSWNVDAEAAKANLAASVLSSADFGAGWYLASLTVQAIRIRVEATPPADGARSAGATPAGPLCTT